MKKLPSSTNGNTARHLPDPVPPAKEQRLRVVRDERKSAARIQQCETERGLLERKFEAAFYASPDPIVISEISDGRIVEVNRSFESWSGYARTELLGRTSIEAGLWVNPDDRSALLSCLARAAMEQEPTVSIRIRSGEIRRLSLAASTFEHAGKSYLLTIAHDVTERERIEQELKLNESRLESLQKLNQMTEARLSEISSFALEEAVRLTQSRIGYVAFVNEDETVLTMHAWSKSAMAECAVEDLTIVYPIEDTGLWGEAVRQRRPVLTNDYSAENPFKNGLPHGHVALQRHMNVPIFEGQKIVMVAGVGNKQADYNESDVRQLTLMMSEVWRLVQRNKTQLALRSRQTLLDNILQSTADGILVVGSSGEVLATNRRFQELWRIPDEVLSSSDDQRLLSHVLEQLADPAAFLKDVNEIYEDEGENWTTLEFRDGRIFERYSRPIPQYGRRSRLWSFRDITERIRAEEELRQAQKMDSVGQLAGGVAHDFNNMLGGIMGAAEILKAKVADDQEASSLVQLLLDSSSRAAELTQQLLMFSRKAPLRLSPMDLHESILKTVHILERSLDKRIQISCRLCDEPALVLGDTGRLENSFLNLGLNARDAMPDGGSLRFETRRIELDEQSCREAGLAPVAGTYLQVSVIDTGSGIPQEHLERIFDPFFTTKAVGKGTGLGLSVVYGVIKEHRGAIKVFSEAGCETEFRMFFPLVSERPSCGAPQDTAARIPSNRSVLLVEDEPIMLKVAQTILEKEGLKVYVAKDGREAVDTYARLHSKIDLVVLDMVLPGLNGRDAFLAMKTVNPDVRAVFASGYTREGTLADLIEEGSVRGFLQKPFRRKDLVALVADALSAEPVPEQHGRA